MIEKAVIPAAGLGTRMFPMTKSIPKEMLPVYDSKDGLMKPAIHYIVIEAIKSGINDILIITAQGKNTIEDYFDYSFNNMKNNLKDFELIKKVRIFYIRQEKPKGLGDAILYAEKHINSNPFAILLGDTFVNSKIPAIKQLFKQYEKNKTSIIGIKKVSKSQAHKYGIVDINKCNSYLKIENLIEKPKKVFLDVNYAAIGRYILTPDIFDYIRKTKIGMNDEVQLTDSLKLMMNDKNIYAKIIEGKKIDVGNTKEYIESFKIN